MQFGRIALCLALALPALAAEPGWDRLSQVSKTQKVKVYFAKDRKPVSGFIQEVSPDGLTFVERGQVMRLSRADIRSVARQSRARAAMWGALIGGGIGGAILCAKTGTIVDQNNPSASDRLGVFAIGAGLFGGAGAAVGAASGMDYTLYRATARPASARAVADVR
jgi:hypothetical protein